MEHVLRASTRRARLSRAKALPAALRAMLTPFRARSFLCAAKERGSEADAPETKPEL